MDARAGITFVGNEGVLVEAGGEGVLIDALFGDGVPAYTTTPRAVVDTVEMARPPFDSVGVALATHVHPDHFNPYSVARHLQHNPRVHFVSTRQTLDVLREKAPGFDQIAGRTRAMAAVEDEVETVSYGGVTVEGFGLSHGKVNYGDVEHLGFVVTVGGFTVVHLGDGIIAERSLRAAGVLDRRIDVALLPFWFLTYPFGQRLMTSAFRPVRVFAIHIPPAHQSRLTREIHEFDPGAVALVDPMARYPL